MWRALTEPELLAEWLLPVAGLELEPGATFRFEARPTSGRDGIVRWLRSLGVDAGVVLFLVPRAGSGCVEHGQAVCRRVVAANGACVNFGAFVLEPY